MTSPGSGPRARVAFLDCTAGVAGDMLLGALIDAGANIDVVSEAVRSLGVAGLGVSVARARRGGFACARVSVRTSDLPDRERHLHDVLNLCDRSTGLGKKANSLARRVFELLAHIEAEAHGTTPDKVHFHEVGAYDALADVVGCAAALEDLGLLDDHAVVTCSPLAAGSGTVGCAHGRMPVPVPAVLNIAAHAGLHLTSGDLTGERTTPTGAALVAAVAEPGALPPMTVRAVGTGGGSRDTADRPNITRVVIGESTASAGPLRGEVLALESTVDDMDPRLWPSVLRALREAGAWDCWTTSIVGRHGRPGQVVTALCSEHVRQAVTEALFRHTPTLGVRWSACQRVTLPRRSVTVPVGPPDQAQPVTVKIAEGPYGLLTLQPEVSDAERVALALGWPVRAVCEAAVSECRRTHDMPVELVGT